jgi:GH25 family lysozyme M1 (1,4-beta-N-acetylmuramidase)
MFARVRYAILLALWLGCAEQPAEPTSSVDQEATVCGVGPTVKGIDVSYYQGTIDWAKVRGAGVEFAFIRVSDGANYIDPKFEAYWAGSRAAGIVHGAYQFFRPGQDAIAQADLLLGKIGTPKPDDLPPVLDVEAADGLSASQVAAKVKAWVDHVAAKLGRAPIIYTGYYFWRDSVGAANLTSSPLWHAQYSTATCPTIAPPWQDWAFWQYTSTGSINGISGGVDVDRWNGNRASLDAFIGAGAACGDGTCDASESQATCPEDCGPCGTIAAAGGEIDDADACFEPGGPMAYMRHVSDAGEGGGLLWTHATADASEANFGQWNLYLAQAGTYEVEVYTATSYAQSRRASYVIHTASGDHAVTIDQSAVDGWQSLGEVTLAAGGHQFIHLADNTGEPAAGNVQLVFDAVRLTSRDASGTGSGSGSGDPPPGNGGCAASGHGSGAGVLLALVGLGLRRRRR